MINMPILDGHDPEGYWTELWQTLAEHSNTDYMLDQTDSMELNGELFFLDVSDPCRDEPHGLLMGDIRTTVGVIPSASIFVLRRITTTVTYLPPQAQTALIKAERSPTTP
jgi:hypothetical protein